MRFICNFIAIILSHAINDTPLQLSEDFQIFIRR
jgi:hypothetical protein